MTLEALWERGIQSYEEVAVCVGRQAVCQWSMSDVGPCNLALLPCISEFEH